MKKGNKISLCGTICFGQSMMYVFLIGALKKISAFTANLTMNLEPIYAIIIALLFFYKGKHVNRDY